MAAAVAMCCKSPVSSNRTDFHAKGCKGRKRRFVAPHEGYTPRLPCVTRACSLDLLRIDVLHLRLRGALSAGDHHRAVRGGMVAEVRRLGRDERIRLVRLREHIVALVLTELISPGETGLPVLHSPRTLHKIALAPIGRGESCGRHTAPQGQHQWENQESGASCHRPCPPCMGVSVSHETGAAFRDRRRFGCGGPSRSASIHPCGAPLYPSLALHESSGHGVPRSRAVPSKHLFGAVSRTSHNRRADHRGFCPQAPGILYGTVHSPTALHTSLRAAEAACGTV